MPTCPMEESRVWQSGSTARLMDSDVILTPDIDVVDVVVRGQNNQYFLAKAFLNSDFLAGLAFKVTKRAGTMPVQTISLTTLNQGIRTIPYQTRPAIYQPAIQLHQRSARVDLRPCIRA
jgi:hypothetical protein